MSNPIGDFVTSLFGNAIKTGVAAATSAAVGTPQAQATLDQAQQKLAQLEILAKVGGVIMLYWFVFNVVPNSENPMKAFK